GPQHDPKTGRRTAETAGVGRSMPGRGRGEVPHRRRIQPHEAKLAVNARANRLGDLPRHAVRCGNGRTPNGRAARIDDDAFEHDSRIEVQIDVRLRTGSYDDVSRGHGEVARPACDEGPLAGEDVANLETSSGVRTGGALAVARRRITG